MDLNGFYLQELIRVLTVRSQCISPGGRRREKVTIVKSAQSILSNILLLSKDKDFTSTVSHL